MRLTDEKKLAKQEFTFCKELAREESTVSISLLNLFSILPWGVVSCHLIVALTVVPSNFENKVREARRAPKYWTAAESTLIKTIESPMTAYTPT